MANNDEPKIEGWVEERLAALDGGDWRPDTARGLELLRRQAGARSGSRRWALTAAGVAGIAAGAMTLPGPRALAEHCVSCSVAFLQGFAGGMAAADLTPDAARRLAPDFTLTDADGRAVRLSDFRGKAVLLNFWATWCNPCAVEIPWFIELQNAHRDDLVVLGVSMDDGWDVVRPFVEAKKVNYRVMLGNDEVAGHYGGVESLPTTLLIDRAGRIAAKHVGLVSEETYRGEIEKLLLGGLGGAAPAADLAQPHPSGG